MLKLRVTDFTMAAHLDYVDAVPFLEAGLGDIAKGVCKSPLSTDIRSEEISLTNKDLLFNYQLSIPMFNRAGELTVTARRISAGFTQGRKSEHAKVMRECILEFAAVAARHPVGRTAFIYTAHAEFDPPNHYDDYMQRFRTEGSGVTYGGITLVGKLSKFEGEIRFSTDKSLFYNNALFVSSLSASHGNVLSAEFLEAAETEAVSIASTHGLELLRE